MALVTHRYSWLHRLSAGLGAAALVTLAGGAAAGARTATPEPGAEAATVAAGASRSVLLINGDRVQAARTATGWTAGRVTSPDTGNLARSLLVLGTGSQTYLIPAAAAPYLGRGLDPRLFEFSALAKAETAGRLPVRIGYRAAVPAVPGVTITSSGGGTARGYLTAASARAFGTALDRGYLAGRAGGSYGPNELLRGGVSIALAGTPAAKPAAAPRFPMETLTVTGTNAQGKPDTGDFVYVFNADDSRRFSDPAESLGTFYHGTAKFSVPAGHYWAIGDFPTVVNKQVTALRLDVLPQFTVTSATTVHVAERAAVSQVTMVTPRPAQAEETDFFVRRDGHSGPPITVSEIGGIPVWVNPESSPPTVGGLQAYASQVLLSPSGPGIPYHYELMYSDPPGAISSQRYVVGKQDLATVSESYYLTQQASGDWLAPGTLPSGGLFPSVAEDTDDSLTAPSQDVFYAGGNVPSLVWLRQYQVDNPSFTVVEGAEAEGGVSLPAGADLTSGWGQYPLHPDANANFVPADVLNGTQPSATRSGNTLRLDTTPFSDNQPGVVGLGFIAQGGGQSSTGTYEIDQNGKKIAGGNAVTMLGGSPTGAFSTHATLSPKRSTIKLTLNAFLHGSDFPLSAASQTVWTWPSAYQPAATLPRGWYCTENPDTGARTYDCAVQPLMTLEYGVPGMALDGSVPAGSQVLNLTVGHLQLAKAAKVTGAQVSVSFDGGQTWQPAQVTSAGPGQFRAAFTAPAGQDVTLRTSATDAAGGAITETITNAYRVAPGSEGE